MNPLTALLKKKSCLLVRILMYKHKGLNHNADIQVKTIYQIDKLLNHKKIKWN